MDSVLCFLLTMYWYLKIEIFKHLKKFIRLELSNTYSNVFNPSSPNSDKDQLFSLNNIHTLSRDKLWE